VGGLSGFGFGIAVQRHSPSDPRQQLRFRLSGSTQQDYRATLGARFPAGQRGGLTLGAGLRDHANTRYFGIGPESTGEEESLYREIQTWVGATYGHRLARSFALKAGFEFSSARAEEPVGDFRPSITERFAGSLPPGFDATSTGLLGRFTIEHDNTDGTGRPNHGGRWVAQAGYFHSLQDQWASHWTIRLEAQQFTRLWFPHTVLALRGVLTWLEPVGDVPIPFQRLLHNNDPDLLRGYQDRRWRDKGLLLLSAEYRWPVWAYGRAEGTGLDCYILTDIGQVFPTLSAIRTSDFTVSYGGGIRLVGGAGFMLRLEYARSTQGGLFRLQTQQTFQFTRGLFHGRDAVPAR
jgi:outer membrane protein assembly factor BamA